jgi:DNA-binding Xre family transcriptional regulator
MFHAGKALSAVMREGGLNRNILADELGVAPNQINRWQNSRDLKLSIVIKVCDIAKINVGQFISLGK